MHSHSHGHNHIHIDHIEMEAGALALLLNGRPPLLYHFILPLLTRATKKFPCAPQLTKNESESCAHTHLSIPPPHPSYLHCLKEKFFFGVAKEKRPTLKSSLNLGKFGSSTKNEIHLEPSLPHFMVVEILRGTYTHTHASTCACFVDCC